MDAFNLHTASTYINNLLLARGLLRNGQSLELAKLATPSNAASEKNAQSTNAKITAQVINLVHDLILRRDRDHDHHESLAFTLRSLRSESERTTTETTRLQERNDELSRQLASCQSSLRATRTAANTADHAARALREDVAKHKTTLIQVRLQCANDIRKRDVQIQKLKSHLAVRQRGNKTGLVGSSISITPGSTGRAPGLSNGVDSREREPLSVEDAEYSLKQESNEFLTELSQGLSNENDALIGLVRGAVRTLRELQGLPHDQYHRHDGQEISSESGHGGSVSSDDMVQIPPTSYDRLSSDLHHVLGRLSELLTNPSFAPIEEVNIREEELQRLRECWEKMEDRWKDAIEMMYGWRKRMMTGGHKVNLEDLRIGLCLGEGLSPSVNKQLANLNIADAIYNDEDDEPRVDGLDSPRASGLLDDESSFGNEEPPVLHDEKLFDKGMTHDLPSCKGLGETNGDRQRSPAKRSAKNPGQSLGQENTGHLDPQQSISNHKKEKPVERRPASQARGSKQNATATSNNTDRLHKARPSPLSEHHQSSHTPAPKLSVQQKLKIAECEAQRVSWSSSTPSTPDELHKSNNTVDTIAPHVGSNGGARNKRPQQEVGVGGSSRATPGSSDDQLRSDQQQVDDLEYATKKSEKQESREVDNGKYAKRDGIWKTSNIPVKRTMIAGRPRKRKSTLSPEELEDLMMGGKNAD